MEIQDLEQKLTEKQYRKVGVDSYSSFKDFIADRRKYYKKYVLSEPVEEKYDFAILMGQVVETLALTPDDFDNKFFLSQGEKPSENTAMNDFVEALYTRWMEFSVDGELVKPYDEVVELAYNDVKFDKDGNIVAFKQAKASSKEVIEGKFSSTYRSYFDEIIASRSRGVNVITNKELQQGEAIKDTLFTHPHTCDIMRMKTNDTQDVLLQVPFFFDIRGYKIKCLIDRLEINHEHKFIQPDDLKVTWNVDKFLTEYYLYRRSDLQAAIYYMACLDFADKYFPDYGVRHMRFIVADSTNQNAPLVYTTCQKDVDDAMAGFVHRGKQYVGLNTVIEDLKWHKSEGIWNASKENYLNNGVSSITEKLWAL